MGHVGCSNLAYAHPGGDLLFDGVSFMVGAGEHAGVVGANGVGKTTLLKLLARELRPEDGEITAGGRLAHMAQDVGAAGETGTVRELLVTLAPAAIRTAGERIAAAEKRLAAGDDAAGVELGTAIGEWSELGGYELEAQWDRSTRKVVRSAFSEIADRPANTLSGGERKRLVLDALFASDAEVLLLDEPDNFLDIPAKRALERQIATSRKTVLVISHDREVLSRAVKKIVTLEGDGAWCTATPTPATRRPARSARSASGTRSAAGRTRSAGSSSS
jgi:ATPase subunit of ABC transporter with duplicated ATPase domains